MLHNVLLWLDDEWERNGGWWTQEEKEKHNADMDSLDREMVQDERSKREALKKEVLTT